jgi:hypothetical protein
MQKLRSKYGIDIVKSAFEIKEVKIKSWFLLLIYRLNIYKAHIILSPLKNN